MMGFQRNSKSQENSTEQHEAGFRTTQATEVEKYSALSWAFGLGLGRACVLLDPHRRLATCELPKVIYQRTLYGRWTGRPDVDVDNKASLFSLNKGFFANVGCKKQHRLRVCVFLCVLCVRAWPH